MPGYSAQRAVVFKTDQALLVVHRFLVYPTGVEFTLSLFLRGHQHGIPNIPWELHAHPRQGALPDDFLRFGILLSDWSKWTNLDWRHPTLGETPTGPVVSGRGGGGGGDSWEMGYWMWPLPPEGPMTFVALWPALDIPEQSAEVDATEIRARSRDAETIWAT